MARDVGRHALLEPILLRRRHRTPYFSDLLVPQLYVARASRFRTAPVVPADQEPATSLHDLCTCPNIAAHSFATVKPQGLTDVAVGAEPEFASDR